MSAVEPRRYVGTPAALAAYRAGRVVVVDRVLLVDGRPAVRVRLPAEVPRRRRVPARAVAGAVVLLAAAGGVWVAARWLLAHAWQAGAVAAVAVLLATLRR